MPAPTPLRFDALLALADPAAGEPPCSPLSAQTSLLFDPAAKGSNAAQRARVIDWLAQLPCPSIALATDAVDAALLAAADVVAADAADAELLTRAISTAPLAASVLVQLLRLGEGLPMAAALTAESLAYATLQAGLEHRQWLASRQPPNPSRVDDQGPPVLLQRDGDVLQIRLNRAARRNAMSAEMRDALVEAFALVAADDSLRAARLSGLGKCFSSGGDLDEFGQVPDAATGHAVRSLRLPARALLGCADRLRVHLHGACIGAGIELPSFASHIDADPGAWFQLPELRYGLIPGAGGCVGIARRIGRQRTAWLVLSGQRIGAVRALTWGLVDALLPLPR
ncbi:MAG: enoyl-CoA hydratase/isomerase family protein [Gammaproteobacteria bacterium]|nr:enoyl-CoA hydratase/isomerase family protein [Gammaproteobacteria bacterium]